MSFQRRSRHMRVRTASVSAARTEGEVWSRTLRGDGDAFAVATKLVTLAEFKKYLAASQHVELYSLAGEDMPINVVSWYDTAVLQLAERTGENTERPVVL